MIIVHTLSLTSALSLSPIHTHSYMLLTLLVRTIHEDTIINVANEGYLTLTLTLVTKKDMYWLLSFFA